MAESTKTWKRHLWECLLLFGVGCCSNLMFCPECIEHLQYAWDDFTFSGLLWIILWKGNEFIADYPDRFINWKEQPALRLSVGIASHVIYSVVASMALFQMIIYFNEGQFRAWNFRLIMNYNFPTVVITIIITLFLTARSFLYSWRDLAVEHEQLKAESMASQLASLKAQVNPHFLFNSLNVLSGLVYRDADLSAQFIKQLSEVYRYVLDRQEEELLPIDEELSFVESVIFLQRIRFGEHLHFSQEVPKNSHFLVAPLALQMLIENAIKHNTISEAQPLYIRLYLEEGYLAVTNNLQPKKILSESLGIGLENIRKRYRFLTDQPILVLQEQNCFSVKLPIIKTI